MFRNFVALCGLVLALNVWGMGSKPNGGNYAPPDITPPAPRSCTFDRECGQGYSCRFGTCEAGNIFGGCTSDAECPSGRPCYNGACVDDYPNPTNPWDPPACRSDFDCFPAQCVNGRCV